MNKKILNEKTNTEIKNNTQNQESENKAKAEVEKLNARISEVKNEIRVELKSVIDNLLPDLGKDEKEFAFNAFDEILTAGATPAKALKLDESFLNSCYSKAYNLYNLGQYKEALKMFELLTNLEPNSTQYLQGLASSYYMLKDYPKAIENYVRQSQIEPTSPFPFYFMINCCEGLGLKTAMVEVIVTCIKLCHLSPEYAQMEDRCHLILDGLIKELGIKKEDLDLPKIEKKGEVQKGEVQKKGAK